MGARILVIEDHPANMQLMEYLLRAFGHAVTSADTGEAGVEEARRSDPDLIACDVQLPGMDGYEVVATLKGGDVPVRAPMIAVTAFAMAGDRQRLLAAGFDGYIAKPIVPETFVAELETFLPGHLHGRMTQALARTVAPGERRPEAARPRILAVDDSPVNLGVLRSILEPHGYDVSTAPSVAVAMAKAVEHRPHLILTDVHMAGEDGFSLLRRVRANAGMRSVRLAFISSSMLEPADRERAVLSGADDVILRPIEPDALLARVSAILGDGSNGHDPRR